jgi:hypothetical protein
MMDPLLDLVVEELEGESRLQFEVKILAHALYCQRGIASDELIAQFVDHLPDEIRRLGLPSVPEKVPAFCRASRYLLTTDNGIEVQGSQTCGEVEMVALVRDGEIFVGLGSDHCDRAIEPYFFYKPKQMAPRVLGPRVWRYMDIQDHWEQLHLSASTVVDGKQIAFQEGTWGELVPLPNLLGASGYDTEGLVLYCGTVGLGEYVYGEEFHVEVHDPVLDRTLRHAYSIHVLQEMP